jgi:hypothetical protein
MKIDYLLTEISSTDISATDRLERSRMQNGSEKKLIFTGFRIHPCYPHNTTDSHLRAQGHHP